MILLNEMLTWMVLKLAVCRVGKLMPGMQQELMEWGRCAGGQVVLENLSLASASSFPYFLVVFQCPHPPPL